MSTSALAERNDARQVASPATTNESTAMLTMIQRAATDPAFDADKMQKMMEMYERHTDRTAAAAFNAAMVRAQSEIGPVFRDKFNAQTNSSYAALESIDRKISPVYTLHGFSLSFGTGDSPLVGHIRTVCDCMHEAGHTKTYHVDLPIDAAGIKGSVNKTGVHASGSTFSYARRYLTMMIFNVVLTNEDNDGNGDGDQPPSIGELMNEWIPKAYAAENTEALTAVWRAGVQCSQALKATDSKAATELYEALKVAVTTRGQQFSAPHQAGAAA
ncbi:ERF superfamily protein [Pseudomonas sp. BS3767]|uniref:ERF superfamily protein n=1 Tax=Pseudomonas syringae TaxID=317 RepID=A0AB37ZPY2_PSESX|nr:MULTISPECIES: ERF family protein [Pseudomonas]SDH70522.1 ERF superfamily protein [Pseudomonas sp. BS3767]SDN40855.1 ERF superfamily protein [Pseudomonas sp. BS3759]SDN48666.1 ERF superfamily protein [Pseudomonas syringae]